MKKYLKYLLADIDTAKSNRPLISKQSDDVDKMFRDTDNFEDAPLQNMSKWFGLDARAFPPAERWHIDELKIIVDAMTELWYVYNYEPAFPEGVDTKLKYRLFVKVLSEPVPWLSSGSITIDFCDSDVNTCALNEFCVCREIVDFVEELPHKDEIIIAQPDRVVEVSASMQRYHEQLLQDMQEALRNLPDHEDFGAEYDFDEEEEALMQSRESKPEKEEGEKKPLAEWVHVPKAVFPKLEQISTEMVIEIVRAIEKLWWYAGFVPFFPDGLNIEMKYQLFREHWNREVPWPTDESVYLEFCDDDEENCIYGAEMCTCALYKMSFGDDEEDEIRMTEDLLGKKRHNYEDDFGFNDFVEGLDFDEEDMEEDEDESL